MKILLSLIAAPIVLAPAAFYFKPELFPGGGQLTPDSVWSFVGVSLSYFGLVFSAYALLEVTRLSNRYFAKQRLPELKKQIEKIMKTMADLEQSKLSDIRSERFMGEVEVVIKQLKKTKSPGFPEVVKRTKRHLAEVEKAINDSDRKSNQVSTVLAYWDLYRSLSQLTDEIKAYELENRAAL